MGKLGKPVLRGENKRLPNTPLPDSYFLSLSGCPDGRDNKTQCLGQAAMLGVGEGNRKAEEAEANNREEGEVAREACLWLQDPGRQAGVSLCAAGSGSLSSRQV